MLSFQKPFRGTQLNRTHPLAKGLVGCWLFNELTGKMVFDLSGYNNNGTLENGVVWGSDGLEFDGTDGYVDIPTPPITGSQNRTIIAQIKTSAINDDIVSWGNSVSGTESRLLVNSTGQYAYAIVGGYAVFESVVDNQLHSVAITINGSLTDDVIGYLDGNLSTRSSLGSLTINTAGVNGAIGRRDTTSDRYFNGSIYSVYIYNRALSAEEIVWSYREPYAMFEPVFNPAIYGAVFTKREILNLTSTIDKTLATTSTIDKTLATTSTIDKTLALSSKIDIEVAA